MSYFNDDNLKVVKTIYGIGAINEAIDNGAKVVAQLTRISTEVYWSYILQKNIKTNKLHLVSDPRDSFYGDKDWITIDSGRLYDRPEKIVAAYTIPENIEINEEVWVEDVIEFIPATSHHGVSRLRRFKGIWNGEKIEILFNPNKHFSRAIG